MKRKKSNKFQLLISSAALLLILLVAAGVTYSWIEGGTTYSIKTENGKDVKTGTAPVMPIANSLTINPGITQEINLNNIDKTTNNTQSLYFSEVSSSDGENFYFPIYKSGEVTSYRAANTNDVGTKFINYDFKVTASKKCYLAFNETPTITATKNGTPIEDTSAFRIMLKCGDEKRILTTAGSKLTSSAVKDINGTTENFTADPVADYVYKSDDSAKLFQLDKGKEKVIEVSVWLDASSNKPEDLIGADVRLNMNLKAASELVKVRVYVEPRSFSDYYAYVFNENDSVHDFGLWTGKQMTEDAETGYYYYKEGTITEDAYFIVNNNAGKQYPTGNMPKNLKIGFTDDKDSYNDEYVTYVLRNDNQWYRFDDTKIKVNAYSAVFDNDGKKTQEADVSKGTVSIDGCTGDVSASKVVYQDTAGGTNVTLTAKAGDYYDFKGWYETAECSGESLSNELSYTYNANKTYSTDKHIYAKFVEKPQYTVTFDAVTYDNNGSKLDNGFTGGKIDNKTTSYSVTKHRDEVVEATAAANTNYTFEGWYTDPDCADRVETAKKLSKTIDSDINGITYYAKFVEKPKHTVTVYSKAYLSSDNITDNAGGTVTVNGGNDPVKAYEGSTVTIKAVANTEQNFRFEGWYTDSTCTTKLDGVNYSQAEKTVTVGTTDVQYYAKFVKQYKVTFKAVLEGGTESSDCGTLKINNETVSSKTVDYGTDVTLSAEAKATYQFKRIYTIVEGIKEDVSTTSTKTVTINSDITYYAEFISKPPVKTTIYFEPRSFTISKAYVFNLDDTKKNYTDGWPGNAVKYDSELGLYYYSFETTDEGQFGVLVNDGGSNQYPGNNQQFVGEIGNTYILYNKDYGFSDTNKSVTLDKFKVVNVSVTPKTYPTSFAATAGGTASASVSKGYKGKVITLTAEPNTAENFRFAGWYTDESCADEYKVSQTDNESTSLNVTLGDTDVTYFAKFVKQYSISVIALTDNEESNVGGNVKIDSKDSPIFVDAGTLFEISRISATANSGYTYGGLYAEDKSTPLVDPSAIINDNVIYYAKFNTKAVDCYLLGTLFSDDSWKPSDSKKMLSIGDGTYSMDVTLNAKHTYEFKVREGANGTWYGSGSEVKSDNSYVAFASDKGNSTIKTTIAGEYIFTYNQKKHELKIKAPESTGVDLPTDDLPTTSKLSSNTLIFNLGLSEPTGCIWFWADGVDGTVRNTPQHTGTSKTVSTCTFDSSIANPKAIALEGTGTEGDKYFPSNSTKQTGDIKNSDSVTGPYYISDNTKTSWSSFTHLTPSLTVSQTTVNVNSSVTLSASVNGTLNSNAKYTFYVQKDGVTYRASNSKTTSNTCTWTPNVAGTYTVYVAAYDEFGIETVVSSPQTVTVN